VFPIDEPEEEPPPPQPEIRSYYEYHPPPPPLRQPDVLEKVSKETIIFGFVMLFIGLLLGKAMTPVILKH
jgi:hypothetical protein